VTGTVPLDSGPATAFRAATLREAFLGFNESAGVVDFPPAGAGAFGLDADAVVARDRP